MATSAIVSYAMLGAPEEAPLFKTSFDYDLHRPAQEIDAEDMGTPDSWIPRNPAFVRHTGRHPLNAEAPMNEIFDAGFITPVAAHFVRNHGAVPKLDWRTHRVEINGLVDRPVSLTMDQILNLPSVTIPVTLTCSGNRRKEINMVKKSIGFNWGPGATGCSEWTGVRLCDVLNFVVGAKSQNQGAKYICFRGPKGELPRGDDGSYGTSLLLSHALDPSNDVILAYKQNGRFLTPDHGFPLRLIVPGFIAGRMVKWLSEMTVTKEESNNFYHYHDNRLLPPHVDDKLAKEEGWWFKPEYAINELNISSAVAKPFHDETLSLRENKPYEVSGYAYTGGGRHVIRVEVSTDHGKTWRQATIDRMNADNAYSKSWGWVFWRVELQVYDFLVSDMLQVRAVDSSQNIQPEEITFNAMGMMNNCHFKVQIHKDLCQDGELLLRFQHPTTTEIGALGNVGWREAAKAEETAAAKAQEPVKRARSIKKVKKFTAAEVAKHNTEESCWFIRDGKVYDATPYLHEHPGGAESILIIAGEDASEDFNAIHSNAAKRLLEKYYIGDLDDGAQPATAEKPTIVEKPAIVEKPVAVHRPPKTPERVEVAAPTSELIALNPKKKISVALSEKIELSHNSTLFRFALPSPQHKLGLPVGQHMFLYASINGESCLRAYTPTSSDSDLGHFDLVVKIYRANQHPDFPEGGKMSQYLASMKIGDTIDVKGPVGHYTYTGHGNYIKNRKPGKSAKLSMIAGGTGITPMYQVIKAILSDPTDTTEIKLLYANRSESDILLREELEELAEKHPNFSLWYTVNKAHMKWAYSTGRIDKDMIKMSTFEASEDGLVMMCGPKPMIDSACKPNLLQLGWNSSQMIEF